MVDRPALSQLIDQLADDYSVDHWGFRQLEDIEDVRQRAVVSDQLLGTADAIESSLRDAEGHLERVVDLHGPNGRAMPDPERPAEEAAMHELDREIAALFRAVGSALDCLAGVAVAVLRLPVSIQRADANALWRIDTFACREDAPHPWKEAARVIAQHREGSAQGWLEWTLETRNAFVHRARLMRTWLPRATRRPGAPQVLVRTETPVHRLLRYDLHLRRSPWHPDMRALSANRPVGEQWLGEPAPSTVGGIVRRVTDLVEGLGEVLLMTWTAIADGDYVLPVPTDAWLLDDPRPAWRVEAAGQFEGFSASTGPPVTTIVMNPRDAKRAELAEALRQLSVD